MSPRFPTPARPGLAAVVLCLPLAALAAEPPVAGPDGGLGTAAVPYRIPRTDSPITVDAELGETAWERAWTHELGYEVAPGENVPAPVRTEVLVTYDAQHLYVAFRAWDPEPAAIRAHLTDRDGAWSDDWVGVVLDTFNDERRNFLLQVNPLGVQMDTIEAWTEGGGTWDGIWESAARITDWGWIAELKVPFSSLRFQRGEGSQVWGFDAIRWYPRRVYHHLGAFPRDRNNNCYLCQAIKIAGFEGVVPGRNLEIAPTVTAVRTEQRSALPAGSFNDGEGDEEAGITARWGMTPSLNLGMTLNPDFSQVEADALQLDVNEPFALFYEEKRPFFMEASDFFATGFTVVYTRSIRDPAWGTSLTGKEGAETIGAFVVRDELTNLIFPGNQSSSATSLALESTAAVARYKHDFGNKYTLGVLLTAREGDGYLNRVATVDGDFRFTPKDRLRFQLLGSRTRYPREIADEFAQPADAFSDGGGFVAYSHQTRTWSFHGGYDDVGADFRADLGFMPRVDYRMYHTGLGYTWNPDQDSWFSRLHLGGTVSHKEDHDGNLLDQETEIELVYEGPMQSHAVLEVERGREAYNGVEFDQTSIFLHNCMSPNAHAHWYLNVTLGDQIDYVNTRLGDRVQLAAGLTYRLGRHLQLGLDHTFERMEVRSGRLYTANVSALAVAYHFNTRAFFRAILQNVDYDHNLALYTDDRDAEYRHLFSQLLFSYKLNPQTVLFLGYSDNYLGNQDYGLTQSDRTVFAKIGYAWTL